MLSVANDLRYALRGIRRRPGFAAAVIATLALGIGANTAIFTVLHTVVLRRLPFADADRLVMLYSVEPGNDKQPFSIPDYLDLRNEARSLDGLVGWGSGNANWTGPEETVPFRAQWTTPGFFGVVGVNPALGRLPLPEEEKPGAPRVVLLGDPLWRSRFAADPSIVGKVLTLNGEPFTVIGVLPKTFIFNSSTAELAAPIVLETDPRRERRNAAFLRLLGKMKPGTTAGEAATDLGTVYARLRRAYPDSNANKEGLRAVPLAEIIVGNYRKMLFVLQAAVGLVLLIACTNLASLLLTRVVGRRAEMALRTALGARRRDLVRQLLVETGLLSLLGGALGFLVALGGVRALLAFGPEKLPRAAEVSIHPPVLIFNLVLALAVGLVLGIVPAFQSGAHGVGVGLRGSGRGETEGRRGGRARASLIAVEVGLSLVLLVGAGLLLRTLGRLQDTSPGFDPERVLAVQLSLPKSRYGDPAAIGRYADEIATRLSRLPGVTHAAAASLNPLTNWRANISYTIDGRSELTKDNAPIANYRAVAPGYFESLGVRLIEGRDASTFDKPDSPPVLLVTETLAKRHFPGGKAVGSRLRIDDVETWRTAEIVGVVGDTRHYGLDTDGTADVFVPYPQVPPHLSVYFANIFCIAVRTDGDPGLLATTVRREITALDRDVAITSIRPMSEAFDASLADRRFYTALLQVFGLAALALALAGIYSVTSFSVVERTREIGVRLSLGSSRGGILRLIVRRAMLPVAAGLAVGVVAARVLGRLMSGLLVGVPHSDVATFLAAGILLAAAAIVASVVPALRATRIDPVRALRAE